MNTNITAQKIALMAIFAAMYVALSFIEPIQIPVGIPGLTISPVALLATLFGLILGPYLGTASALLGATVAWTVTGGSPYGLPFLLSPALNAFVSGAIFYKKWKMAFAVFAVLIIAFPFTPPVLSMANALGSAQVAVWVLWDKIIALLLILPLAFFSKRLSAGQGAALFFILAFVGNQADNIWGDRKSVV
jgi:predicted membrane protein